MGKSFGAKETTGTIDHGYLLRCNGMAIKNVEHRGHISGVGPRNEQRNIHLGYILGVFCFGAMKNTGTIDHRPCHRQFDDVTIY